MESALMLCSNDAKCKQCLVLVQFSSPVHAVEDSWGYLHIDSRVEEVRGFSGTSSPPPFPGLGGIQRKAAEGSLFVGSPAGKGRRAEKVLKEESGQDLGLFPDTGALRL